MSAKNDMIMAALESAKIKFNRLTMGDKEMILNIVDFVCKAQRNACLRESDKYKTALDIKIKDSEREAILNAEVSKEDYENISN